MITKLSAVIPILVVATVALVVAQLPGRRPMRRHTIDHAFVGQP